MVKVSLLQLIYHKPNYVQEMHSQKKNFSLNSRFIGYNLKLQLTIAFENFQQILCKPKHIQVRSI